MTHHSAARPRSPLRLIGAALAGAAAVLLVLALGTLPADAHATLVGTDPTDGQVLAEAPVELVLTFNEPVQLGDEPVRVLDSAGEELDVSTGFVDTEGWPSCRPTPTW